MFYLKCSFSDLFQFTASAPTPISVIEFFESAKVTILNIYGCSENSGPATLSLPGVNVPGAVGKVMCGTEAKIDKPNRFVVLFTDCSNIL